MTQSHNSRRQNRSLASRFRDVDQLSLFSLESSNLKRLDDLRVASMRRRSCKEAGTREQRSKISLKFVVATVFVCKKYLKREELVSATKLSEVNDVRPHFAVRFLEVIRSFRVSETVHLEEKATIM